jgi:acetolactate synthase I/II/III large subunit
MLGWAFNGFGGRAEPVDDFVLALQRALASNKPVILHCVVDLQALMPAMTLDWTRDRALSGTSHTRSRISTMEIGDLSLVT